MIVKLTNSDTKIATEIRNVFQKSYVVEAELLKAENFPPLKRPLEQFITTDTVFYGFLIDEELVAVTEIKSNKAKTHIQSLVVLPKHFKKGIASKLLDFVFKSYASSPLFIVETGAANIPAKNLYLKKGFKEVKEWDTDYGIRKTKFEMLNTNLSKQIAKHFKELHFGGNWTGSNLKEALNGVTWQQATTQVYDFNTIATLVFHINYYVSAVLNVFKGEKLNAKDELSFNHPPINSQEDWDNFLNSVWDDIEQFIPFVEQLPEHKLLAVFEDEKYGNYYRNIQGIIEHSHYHLGQIVLIKKIITK